MATLVNLFQSALTVIATDSTPTVLPGVGANFARIVHSDLPTDSINDVPVTVKTFSRVENLPDPVDGTYYIVPPLVAAYERNRNDLLLPVFNAGNMSKVVIRFIKYQ